MLSNPTVPNSLSSFWFAHLHSFTGPELPGQPQKLPARVYLFGEELSWLILRLMMTSAFLSEQVFTHLAPE